MRMAGSWQIRHCLETEGGRYHLTLAALDCICYDIFLVQGLYGADRGHNIGVLDIISSPWGGSGGIGAQAFRPSPDDPAENASAEATAVRGGFQPLRGGAAWHRELG